MGIPRPGLVSLALLLGCSSSSANALKGGADGGHLDATTGHDGGSGGSSSGGGSSGGGDGSGGPSVDCGAPPSLSELLADSGAIFCTVTGSGPFECPPYQVCCLGGLVNGSPAPDECSALGTPCSNGTGDAGPEAPLTIECNGIVDCVAQGLPGATSCCLKGAQTTSGCSFPLLSGGNSIACETDDDGGLDAAAPEVDGSVVATPCAAGETQVCDRPSDCPTGKTCTAATWNGRPLGICK